MTTQNMLSIFLTAAGIELDNAETITLGQLLPYMAPAGIVAVMDRYVVEMQLALTALPPDSNEAKRLHAYRCFTYAEFLCLWKKDIRPDEYRHYPIFQALHITTAEQRRRWLIYIVTDDMNGYLRTLLSYLSPLPQSALRTFFFPVHAVGTYQPKCACPNRRQDWRGEKQAA